MTIVLPSELERFVYDEVLAGRYRSEDDVIRDALERLRNHTPPPTGLRMTEDGLSRPTLVSADQDLNAAAIAEGLDVDNPTTYP